MDEPSFGSIGSRKWTVSPSATPIYAGEPIVRVLGGYTVKSLQSTGPVVGTDYIVGISASNSTHTATATGTVEVVPMVPGQVWLGNPTTSTSWDTQFEYDYLVGDRVLLAESSAGVYTVGASDGATSGLVVQPLDITRYPGKVAFSFRNDCSDLHA